MNTPTHSLLALALLSKKGDPKRNCVILIGSLIPDVAVYLWAPYQHYVNGASREELWRDLYFQPPMQALIALFNSIPIYFALAGIGWIMRGKIWGKLVLFFSLAALIHMATDMPVHSEDAYRHFWPFSDWRFYSPLSYWDTSHHSGWVSLFESFLALTSIVILWRRFPELWVKITLSLLALLYIALQVMKSVAPF